MFTRSLLAVLLLCQAGLACAQDFPNKPIRLISSFAAGSTVDIVARALSQPMSETLGQPVVVEDRGGAGGNIAMDTVAKAPKDGYTIGIGTGGALAINPTLMKSMPYDVFKDLAPVSLVALVPNALVVGPSVKAANVKELIEYAKQHPGELNFASSGVGSVNHLAGELFQSRAGVKLVHTPYKGNQDPFADLMAGRVQMMFTGIPPVLGMVRSGQLRVLAIAGKNRMAMLPDVPTMAEAGLPNAEAVASFSMVAPAGTPQAAIDRLQTAVAKALARPDVRERLASLGAEPVGSSPAELGKFMHEEMGTWGAIVKSLNISVE